MPNPKHTRLSQVIKDWAPEGSNDRRWFLLEHQLYQAKVSLQAARGLCERIGDTPENEEEWELARSTLELLSPVYVQFLGAHAATLSLLAGTGVAERVGRKEK